MTSELAWIDALRQAVEMPHTVHDRLYWNGEMFCWSRSVFIKPDSGWMLVCLPMFLLEQVEEESVCAA